MRKEDILVNHLYESKLSKSKNISVQSRHIVGRIPTLKAALLQNSELNPTFPPASRYQDLCTAELQTPRSRLLWAVRKILVGLKKPHILHEARRIIKFRRWKKPKVPTGPKPNICISIKVQDSRNKDTKGFEGET